jgi:tight adherence protein C
MINLTVESCIWVATLTAVFSGVQLWRIASREEAQRVRLEVFRGEIRSTQQKTGNLPWYRQLGNRVAASSIIGAVEQQRLIKLLAQAGIKGRGSLANFLAVKVCSSILSALLLWLLIEWRQLFVSSMTLRLLALSIVLLYGWRIPEIILNRMVKRRQSRLAQGMPDALDLLVVCSEAGLSLNQAIEEVSRQLRLSSKDVADEFATTSAEMRVLPDFGQALDNLVERTGLADLRSLVATLKQSLKFGTSLADSLRVIAGEMRNARQLRIETRAARLPVLLAIPMMMFILPCLLIVVGTPAALRIIDMFKNITIAIPSV